MFQVKKYNFDMIEKFPPGQSSGSHLYCSLNCLNLHNLHNVSKTGSATTASYGTWNGGTRPQAAATASLPVISAVSSLATTPAAARGAGASLPTEPIHPSQLQQQAQPQIQVGRDTFLFRHFATLSEAISVASPFWILQEPNLHCFIRPRCKLFEKPSRTR